MTPAQCKVLHAGSLGLKIFRSHRKTVEATKVGIFAPLKTIDALVRKGMLSHAIGFNEYEPTNEGLDVFSHMRKDWTSEALDRQVLWGAKRRVPSSDEERHDRIG